MSRLLQLTWERDSAGYEVVELDDSKPGFDDILGELADPTYDAEPFEILDQYRVTSEYEYKGQGFDLAKPAPRLSKKEREKERRLYIRGKGGPPIRYHPLDREPTLFKVLSETELTPEGACSFASQFGLLSAASKKLSPWLMWKDRISSMRRLVLLWEMKPRDTEHYIGKELEYKTISETFNHNDFGNLVLRMHHVAGSNKTPSLRLEPRTLWGGLLLQYTQAVTNNTMLRKCDHCGKWFSVGTGTGRRNTAKFCADRCRVASHRQKGSRGT